MVIFFILAKKHKCTCNGLLLRGYIKLSNEVPRRNNQTSLVFHVAIYNTKYRFTRFSYRWMSISAKVRFILCGPGRNKTTVRYYLKKAGYQNLKTDCGKMQLLYLMTEGTFESRNNRGERNVWRWGGGRPTRRGGCCTDVRQKDIVIRIGFNYFVIWCDCVARNNLRVTTKAHHIIDNTVVISEPLCWLFGDSWEHFRRRCLLRSIAVVHYLSTSRLARSTSNWS